ncbi:hypothetical protein [Nocardia terpenica]|uniref:Uncharacterized protein n=1 Tax=Nocardia terpenica TaxID=455432 RepID=A0A164H1A9_9NOCA|nr:hypothetical protein [Nocardia terpenica]KZM68118.1 hypothetical protein AWN90_09255 [Nocardia terpenica]NQE89024.1 hypothetical protein [Nocardia terpenica]
MSGTATVLSRNAKAVVSTIGGVLSVIVSVAALAQYTPVHIWGSAGGVLAVLEVLRSVNVWLVRNEPLVEQAAAAVGDLVDKAQAAAHQPPIPPVVPAAAGAVAGDV